MSNGILPHCLQTGFQLHPAHRVDFLLLNLEFPFRLIPPQSKHPGILPVPERASVENAVGADLPVSAEDQLLRPCLHSQFLPQLPEGRRDEIHACRDMSRAGNIIAARPGVLGPAPLLKKNFQLSRPHTHQPHMRRPVTDALGVGLLPGHHRPCGQSVFVHHVQ